MQLELSCEFLSAAIVQKVWGYSRKVLHGFRKRGAAFDEGHNSNLDAQDTI